MKDLDKDFFVQFVGAVPMVASILAIAIGPISTWSVIVSIVSVCCFALIMYASVRYRDTIDEMHRDYDEISEKYIDVNSDRQELLEEQAERNKANADYVKLVGEQTRQIEQLQLDKEKVECKLDAVIAQHKTEADELENQLKDTTDKATLAIQALLAEVQTLKRSVHEIDLTCAYCNTIQPVPFDIAAGEFTCKKCSNTNAVHTNIFTARTNTLLK